MSASRSHLAVAFGLVVFALVGLEALARYQPHTWIQRDGRFYTNVNVTLTESASLDQGEFAASWYRGDLGWNRSLDAGWSNVALGREGEHLPKHPLLLPVLSTPFYWALGIPGTLLFNLLLFGLGAGLLFHLASGYGSRAAAALAAGFFFVATGVHDHAYDYHVDPLLLCCVLGSIVALRARCGLAAGVLFALGLTIKPTTLMWAPSALLLLPRGARRTFLRAIAGGALVLVAYAALNTWLFGRPWWAGYNRVLVVVDGEPRIADHVDSFTTPLAEGLARLWSGHYGLRPHFGLLLAALPGLVVLSRRRPRTSLAALLALAPAVFVFAKFHWEGHRFLWPALALLVPGLACTFDGLGALRRRPAAVVALGSLVGLLWHRLRSAPDAFALEAAVLPPPMAGPSLQRLAEEVQYALMPAAHTALTLLLLALGMAGIVRWLRAAKLPAVAAVAIPLAFVTEAFPHGTGPWLFAALGLAFGASVPVATGRREVSRRVRFGFVGLAGVALLAALGKAPAPELDGLASLGGFALLPLLARRPRVALALALPLGAGVLLGGGASALAGAFAALALAIAVSLYARPLLAVLGRRRRPALALLAAALLLMGTARRLEAPFRFDSYFAVRDARVYRGRVPCDFLAWEHMVWECATYDRGLRQMVGLATSDPIRFGGERLFQVPTGGGRRVVSWDTLGEGGTLELTLVAAEVQGRLDVEVELGEQTERFTFARSGDTRRWRGEAGPGASLRVEVTGRGLVGLAGGVRQ